MHVKTRLSQGKFILNRSKFLLNEDCRKLLYYGHVYPFLQSGIHLWGNMLSCKQRNELFKKQKEIIRIISNARFNAHTDPLFAKLNVLKLDQIIELETCKFSYKLVNDLLPVNIVSQFHNDPTPHNYNLRKRPPPIVKHQSKLYNQSILCKANSVWNKLPVELKLKQSLSSFTNSLKKKILT